MRKSIIQNLSKLAERSFRQSQFPQFNQPSSEKVRNLSISINNGSEMSQFIERTSIISSIFLQSNHYSFQEEDQEFLMNLTKTFETHDKELRQIIKTPNQLILQDLLKIETMFTEGYKVVLRTSLGWFSGQKERNNLILAQRVAEMGKLACHDLRKCLSKLAITIEDYEKAQNTLKMIQPLPQTQFLILVASWVVLTLPFLFVDIVNNSPFVRGPSQSMIESTQGKRKSAANTIGTLIYNKIQPGNQICQFFVQRKDLVDELRSFADLMELRR